MSTFKPTAAQSRAIQVAINPENLYEPTAIAGPAGSGKTLVAAEIANQFVSQTSIDFFDDGGYQNLYFITYTNELKGYVEDKLKRMLGSDQRGITVQSVHRYLKQFLLHNGFKDFYYLGPTNARMLGIKMRKTYLRGFVEDNKETLGLTGCLADVNFLNEEIGWLLGQGIRNWRVYRDMQRTGRRTRLNKSKREKVFKAYGAYMTYLKSEGERNNTKIIDFDDIGNQVINFCQENDYEPIALHLIVDEVQDLPRTWIEALNKTANGKIVYAGDPSQSIYGRGFTWRDVTGQRIRPIHLPEDFRSTQQIIDAARSLMDFDHSPEGEVGQNKQRRTAGDKPKLVFCRNRESQTQKAIDLIAKLRDDDPMATIAIAAPRRECLNDFKRRCRADIITTLHSFKGLEADHVILASLDEDVFDFTNEYTQEDTNRHLLYVGMTRAKKSLTMMTATDRPAPVLFELSADYVDLDDSENPAAHRAMLAMRELKAQESRESFEKLVEEKVKKEEVVEQAEAILQQTNAVRPFDGKDVVQNARLEKELSKLREQLRKSEEKLQDQENELRIYRARERSDQTVAETKREPLLFVDDAKILILGGLGVKSKDLPGIFKHEGLPKDAFEYLDYDEVHSGKFDASEMLDSIYYSDIFVSTTPHSAKGIGGSSSLVEYLEKNAEDLPKLTIFRGEDGTLKKASRTDLKVALHNSALYAAKKGI